MTCQCDLEKEMEHAPHSAPKAGLATLGSGVFAVVEAVVVVAPKKLHVTTHNPRFVGPFLIVHLARWFLPVATGRGTDTGDPHPHLFLLESAAALFLDTPFVVIPLRTRTDHGLHHVQHHAAADQVGDLVTFSIDQNRFSVNVTGESDAVNVSYESGELQELVCDNPVKSQYSLQYLLPLAKRIEATVETVTAKFGENYPLRLEFTFADGGANVIYFLAPRVEGDA